MLPEQFVRVKLSILWMPRLRRNGFKYADRQKLLMLPYRVKQSREACFLKFLFV